MASPVRLRVYVQARATRSELAGRYGEYLRVRIAAPAVDGAANAALLAFIAQRLEIPRRDVRLHGGERARRKTLEISGVDAARVARLFAAS
jgi:hypothetical protein